MKRLLPFVVLCVLPLIGRAQTVTLDLTLGRLSTASGAAIADGSLLQLIASADNVFGAPSGTQFASGNDLVVASLSFDSSTYFDLSGYMQVSRNVDLSVYPIASHFLLVRWYPTLTTGAATPGYSTAYGQYGYANDTLFVAPAAGGTLTLDASAIASPANRASQTTAAIPEPSTYAAALGLLALSIAVCRRRRKSYNF